MANIREEPLRPSSPIVARRWLGRELRRLREAAKYGQKDVAKSLGCSVGRISYIENGERSPQVSELADVLLPLYRVSESDRPAFIGLAETANQRGWWDDWDDASLPQELRRCIGLEDGARHLRSFQSSVVPGLLQTPEYIRGIMRTFVTRAEVDANRQVRLRRQRQAILVREPHPVNAQFILHEGALHSQVGTAETLRHQLLHIADIAERSSNVDLHVLPFAGGHGGFAGPFTMLDFNLSGDSGVIYLETFTRLEFLEGAADIAIYREAFDRMLERALTPDESVQFVRSLAIR